MKKRIHQIDLFRKYPVEVQAELFEKLMSNGSFSEWGKRYDFKSIEFYRQFQERVPLQTYDDVKPWIDRTIAGEQGLLWPTDTKWFAKSSGTTSDRSKLIPVTRDSLEECHQKGGKDLLALYYENNPTGRLYSYKHMVVGGSAEVNPMSEDSYTGDLSAIIMKNLPWWAEIRRTPSREIALMNEWEEKIERMARTTMNEDIGLLVGVPSWTMVIANRILEITGKSNLKEVWPNLECFMHGGVSFDPYREEFKKLIPDSSMNYVESYNASEGFFGIQDQKGKSDLLLMLDYGIFYEFIPMEDFDGVHSKKTILLGDVEIGKQYAIVISTNGGLWRYIVGDTIAFSEKYPFRFHVTGRTKSFINAFGEELIVDNAEKAVAYASLMTQSQVRDYTACPVFMTDTNLGGHEWLFEFVTEPTCFGDFLKHLDTKLREINSDYDAKRTKDLAMVFPKGEVLPAGSFDQWLKSKGKLGGQNKIPRLSNTREILEQIVQGVTV
ncbi:MAG: GH3 auxin-responsive promoter family protein [Crocinitomicaceae bacterium]